MKIVKRTDMVQKALTTPMYYQYNRIKKTNSRIASAGARLLKDALVKYVTEEAKFKFANSIVGRLLSSENLAKVFDILKERYQLEFQDAPDSFYKRFYKNWSDSGRVGVRADLLKAMAYAVYPDQKEVYRDILEEIKKTISVENDPVYQMKVIIADAGDGFLDAYIATSTDGGVAGKIIFRAELKYKEIIGRGSGLSKGEAKVRACGSWIKQNLVLSGSGAK